MAPCVMNVRDICVGGCRYIDSLAAFGLGMGRLQTGKSSFASCESLASMNVRNHSLCGTVHL